MAISASRREASAESRAGNAISSAGSSVDKSVETSVSGRETSVSGRETSAESGAAFVRKKNAHTPVADSNSRRSANRMMGFDTGNALC